MKLVVYILLAFVLLNSTGSLSPADAVLTKLTLREKIAQLVQIRVPGRFLHRQSPEFQEIRNQIRQNRVGGVVLFAGDIYESAVLLNDLQNLSELPLLVSADFERGAAFRIADTTSFPWTMALGAAGSEELAYQQGLVTAREARALGVHWIFAPVVDVNNNPDNPVINIRSFGEDPALVSRLGAAFIRGAKEGGVLTTAKHFPGHGDTTTDSHLGLAVVESDMDRLQAVELAPFREAIKAGVDSIMTAHVAVPEITGSDDTPATLSSKILTDVLRNSLGFRGIVVTDALEMGAISNTWWSGLAAVRALQAGADILLLPGNATVAIDEVERAVKRGDISEERIDQSVRKILQAKSRLGLYKSRTVPLDGIAGTIASPESLLLAQKIADQSITAVKDDKALLPVNPLGKTRILSLVLASDLESSPASVFQAEMRRRFQSVRTAWANQETSAQLLSRIDRLLAASDIVVCSTLTRLSSGASSAIAKDQQDIIRKLVASKKPVIWVSFGSPYVIRLVPGIGTYLCAFSYSDVSQVAAAKAISGEIAITGRMPVSIPGHARIGQGLQVPKFEMTLKAAKQPSGFEQTKRVLESLVKTGVFAQAEIVIARQSSIKLHFRTSEEPLHDPDFFAECARTPLAAMLAVDTRAVLPEAPVRDYLPETTEKLRIKELLKRSDRKQMELIRAIVSRATGMTVEQLVENRLLLPLGISQKEMTAMDFAAIAQMLLNRGVYDHKRYLSSGTVAAYTGGTALWSKPSGVDSLSSGSFGFSSAAGSFLWIDPARQLLIVLTAKGTKASDDNAIVEAQREIMRAATAGLP